MECCLVSSVAEGHCLCQPLLCSVPCSRPKHRAAASTNTLIPLGMSVTITWVTTVYTSSSSHTHSYIQTPQWNAFLFREWDSQENRVEVSVLKIQEPGSSTAVWAKNSTVLLLSQSVLLTKAQERTLCPSSCLCFMQERSGSAESLKLILIYLCAQKQSPLGYSCAFNKLAVLFLR